MIWCTQNPTMTIFIKTNQINDGINHKNALYITIATRGKYLPMVLVDNRLWLNVFPLKVTTYLGLGLEDFTPTKQIIKAYDNSKREVIETVTIDATIS